MPFFEDFAAEVRRLQRERSGVSVSFAMQTNGVLIDAEWARFLKREGFLLGGCRRDREPAVGGLPGLNRYCPAFKQFFAYAGERIMEMAAAEAEARKRGR